MANQELQKDRLESEEKREGARLGVKIATETDKARREDVKQGIELGREIAKDLTETNE